MTRLERGEPPVIDGDPVGRCRGKFAAVDRGDSTRDDRPCVRVWCRFAGEVSGIELVKSGFEVGVKRDTRDDPAVSVELNEIEYLGVERLAALTAARVAGAHEGEALAAGRDNRRRHVRDPQVRHRARILDRSIPTASDPRVHGPTAIVTENVGVEHLGYRVPVAGYKARLQTLVGSACRVLQPRCRSA